MMDNPTLNVTKGISDALQNDPRTKKSVIDVSYNQGVVALTGRVKSAQEAQAAEEVARKQPGVVMVTNELHVG